MADDSMYVRVKDVRKVVERWFGAYAVVAEDGGNLVMVERDESGDVDRLKMFTAAEIADAVGVPERGNPPGRPGEPGPR